MPFQTYEFNAALTTLVCKLVAEDDRNWFAKCGRNRHQFAVSAHICVDQRFTLEAVRELPQIKGKRIPLVKRFELETGLPDELIGPEEPPTKCDPEPDDSIKRLKALSRKEGD